jgi:cellobiose epimerase
MFGLITSVAVTSEAAARRASDTAWPLAGTPEYDRIPTDWRTSVADRLERDLQRHVIEPWFPRTIDTERGGFRTDFDRHWRPMGPDDRMLEYQARNTRSVARLGQAYVDQEQWVDYARHGVRYIEDVMHDRAYGGWYWLVNRDGEPLAGGSKHAHSTAYIIGAFVEAYVLTRDEGALELAVAAFDWLDATLHDDEHGGFHGWVTRDGELILRPEQAAILGREADPLGHEIGLKDLNVHSDLLESLRLLYSERPTEILGARIRELYGIVEHNFMAPDGHMRYLVRPDLTPVAGPEHPGYAFQCAFRMPLIAPFVGQSQEAALELARRMVDASLASGREGRKPGLLEKLAPPSQRVRAWWVQTEAIEALLLLELNGTTRSYRADVDELLHLVQTELLDERHGGWYQIPRSDWSLAERARVRRLPKAHRWKDVSHETDMSVSTIRMLRGLAADAPLRSAVSSA